MVILDTNYLSFCLSVKYHPLPMVVLSALLCKKDSRTLVLVPSSSMDTPNS